MPPKGYAKHGLAGLSDTMGDYRFRAKRRGLEFSLTPEQFAALITSDCYYCGAEPKTRHLQRSAARQYTLTANGVDRVDPAFGYTPENTVACCETCNEMKLHWSKEDFLDHVRRIASRW